MKKKKKALAQAEFNQNFPDRAKLIQSVELGMCKVRDISSCELETESSYNCIYSYLPDISSDTTWSSRKDKLAKEESNFRLNKNVCLTKKENCQRGSIFKPVPMNQIIQVLGDHGFSQYIKKMKMILEGKNPAESCRENL